jgi:hypothetical protein
MHGIHLFMHRDLRRCLQTGRQAEQIGFVAFFAVYNTTEKKKELLNKSLNGLDYKLILRRRVA